MNPMWELLWLRSWQYGCVRFNLATAKKRFVQPPMVAILAIWLRLLSMLAKKKWLRDILWFRSWQYGCIR